jgi:hypothetical protein
MVCRINPVGTEEKANNTGQPGQFAISNSANQLKIPVNHLRYAVVHVDGVAVAEQRFASFLNPHGRFFRAINHEVLNFMDRFIEKTGGLENRPVVHADDQGAVKLVEIEFDKVFVRVANFQGEFHKSCAGAQSSQHAIPVPLGRSISLANHSGPAR